MENCLVTKLKTDIQRGDLPVLGALRYYIESLDGVYPYCVKLGWFESNGDIEIKLDDPVNQFTDSFDGNNIGSQVSYNKTTSTAVYIRMSKAGWLSIRSKYGLTSINNSYGKGLYCRASDFRGMYYVKDISIENCAGDIKDLDINNDITVLLFNCQSSRGYKTGTTYGDISNLSKYTNLKSLDISKSSIKGNIEDLYILVKSTEIYITLCDKVFGDIKILADKMYQAGRTSGTLKIWTWINPTNITYNGEHFSSRVWNIVFSDEGHSDTNTKE